jgi:DNA-binding NarL/FixJ family response regulator
MRIMLADDHAALREGLRALFTAVPGVEVVHDVGDVESAIEGVRTWAPDVLVLDLSMPAAGGLSAIRAIRAAQPRTAIVILTRYRDPAFVREALAAGASGYVLKQSPFNELRRATASAMDGRQYLDERIRPTSRGSSPEFKGQASVREREVLRLTALGQSNKEIASALNIAVRTVEVHKTHGMRKLGLTDRSGLIRYGVMQGWLKEP